MAARYIGVPLYGRGVVVYLFDAIFILSLTYPLLMLLARKSGRRSG